MDMRGTVAGKKRLFRIKIGQNYASQAKSDSDHSEDLSAIPNISQHRGKDH
jgi:hypothetical protein